MSRDDAILELNRRSEAIRAHGACALFLYGSVALNQPLEGSDVDLFIDYEPDGAFSLVELTSLKHYLEAALGAEVDLTTRDSLHPMLRADIEKSAVRIF